VIANCRLPIADLEKPRFRRAAKLAIGNRQLAIT